MKTLRLSDEDYEALINVLEYSVSSAETIAEEWGTSTGEEWVKYTVRVRDLFKAIEYEEAPCKSE